MPKIPLNWLNSSAWHSSWQGWELSWELSFHLSKNHPCKEVLFSQTICFHTEHWDKHLAGERPISLFSPVLHSTWGVGGEQKKKIKWLQNCIYFTFNSCLFYTFLLNASSRHQHKEPCEEKTPREDCSFKSRKYSLIHWASQGFLGSFYCIDAAIQPLHTLKHRAKFTRPNLLQFMEFSCIPWLHVTFCYCYPLQRLPREIFRSADTQTAEISFKV